MIAFKDESYFIRFVSSKWPDNCFFMPLFYNIPKIYPITFTDYLLHHKVNALGVSSVI